MPDITAGRPVIRAVPLMFTTVHGNPFTDHVVGRVDQVAATDRLA